MAWVGALVGAASSIYSATQQGKGSTSAQGTPAMGANTLPQPPYMQQPGAAGTMGNQGYLEYLMKMLQQGR